MVLLDAVSAGAVATAYETKAGMTFFPVQLKLASKELVKMAPGLVNKVMLAIEALNTMDGMADVQDGIDHSNRNPESSQFMQDIQREMADGKKGTPVTPGIIQFQTLDEKPLSTKASPKTKADFDKVFCTMIDSKGSLWLRWIVVSPIVFGDIRNAANNIVAPIKGASFTLLPNFANPTHEYVPLGFFVNIHARTTNRSVFHQELSIAIRDNYEATRQKLKFLPECYEAPAFYVTPSFAAGKGKISGIPTDARADALVLYVAKHNKVQATVLFNQVYAKDSNPTSVFFVPFHMKHEKPDQFAALVAIQNAYNANHRTIQLAGISPDMMDYPMDCSDTNDPATSLWTFIQREGMIRRIDPTPYVHTEGKWNLSVTAQHYSAVKAAVDDYYLAWLQRLIPASCPGPSSSQFSGPCRLYKGSPVDSDNNSISNRSTVSAMTEYSGMDYNSVLADTYSHIDSILAATTIHPNSGNSTSYVRAWDKPLDLSGCEYSFDMARFPKLPNPTNTSPTSDTSTTHMETTSHQASAVSGLTEAKMIETVATLEQKTEQALAQLKSDMAKQMQQLQKTTLEELAKTKVQQQALDSRLAALDSKLDTIAEEISKEVSSDITQTLRQELSGTGGLLQGFMQHLMAQDGPLASITKTNEAQQEQITKLHDAFDQNVRQMEGIMRAHTENATKVHSPNCFGSCFNSF